MKNLVEYINEATNKDRMFMGLTSRRTQEDFAFKPGEKVFMIKYTTHHYEAQLREVFEIAKVGKNNVKLNTTDNFYTSKKFDKYGICVEKNVSRDTVYWVLYNAELSHEEEIEQLLTRGSCSWGFSADTKQANYNARLQEMISEVTE